ncbi:MAG TPA: hypothetical protein VFD27_11945 [Chthoniobacteraceae bacterium]|jgi:hypothetical protein|nr:hypothetical protein [Chthoniobacteraceae bacterium]
MQQFHPALLTAMKVLALTGFNPEDSAWWPEDGIELTSSSAFFPFQSASPY